MKHNMIDVVMKYFNSGHDVSDYLLECMSKGRDDMLKEWFSSEECREFCDKVLGLDYSSALRAYNVLWVEAAKIASSKGVPDMMVDGVFSKCIHGAATASTPKELERLTINCLLEFAVYIRDTNYFSAVSPLVARVIKYIRSNIMENTTIDEIATALCISKSQLSHQVKKETGDSVHRIVLREKIEAAKNLLANESISIYEISQKMGFSSQSHFSKIFRQYEGISPTEYRKEFTKK